MYEGIDQENRLAAVDFLTGTYDTPDKKLIEEYLGSVEALETMLCFPSLTPPGV